MDITIRIPDRIWADFFLLVSEDHKACENCQGDVNQYLKERMLELLIERKELSYIKNRVREEMAKCVGQSLGPLDVVHCVESVKKEITELRARWTKEYEEVV